MYVFSLAVRYAGSRLVNIAAVCTVALCVLVQIVVMAVLDGVLEEYMRRVEGLGEQMRIELPAGGVDEAVYDRMAERMEAVDGVRGVTPVHARYAAFVAGRTLEPVIVRGIDLEKENRLGTLPEFSLDRSPPSWTPPGVDPDDATRDGVIVGASLADRTLVGPGDEVSIEFGVPGERRVERRRFVVAGRFRSNIDYLDRYFVYVPLASAQEMFAPEGRRPVSTVAVWLEDPRAAPELLDDMLAVANDVLDDVTGGRDAFRARGVTWLDTWGGAAEAMAHENMLQDVVMAFISLSGAFCIFAVMSTLVAGRIRDVGLLRSVGASRVGVCSVFVLTALVLGAAGALLGAVGGVALAPNVEALWESITGQELYPPHLFGVKHLPVIVSPLRVVAYACAAVLMSVVAGLLPAVWAARCEPLEALRHE